MAGRSLLTRFAPGSGAGSVGPERAVGRAASGPGVGLAAVGAVLAADAVIQVVNVRTAHPTLSTDRFAVLMTCFAGVLVLQVRHSVQMMRRRRPRWWQLSLAAQVVLSAAAPLAYGLYWGGLPAFALASCLLLLPAAPAWTLVAGLEAATVVVAVHNGAGSAQVVYLATANVTAALALWALTRMTAGNSELAESRSRARELALARERTRISRDLHDLLGYSLSAMTLKGELASRLVASDAARARTELREVAALARQAALDVRAVTHGAGELTLRSQLESARQVLTSAGVALQTALPDQELPALVDAVLATVVREAVTNLLRHSTATRCEIDIRVGDQAVTARIDNDGAPPRAAGPSGGLANLQARLTSIGGRLHVDDAAGRFGLTAAIPLAEA